MDKIPDDAYRENREYANRLLAQPWLRAQVWDKTWGFCWYCGDRLNPFENFSIDHVVPVWRGGSNHIDNLVPCCSTCNARKGNGTAERLRRALGHDQCGTSWSFRRVHYLQVLGLYAIEPEPARRFRFYGETLGQRL